MQGKRWCCAAKWTLLLAHTARLCQTCTADEWGLLSMEGPQPLSLAQPGSSPTPAACVSDAPACSTTAGVTSSLPSIT